MKLTRKDVSHLSLQLASSLASRGAASVAVHCAAAQAGLGEKACRDLESAFSAACRLMLSGAALRRPGRFLCRLSIAPGHVQLRVRLEGFPGSRRPPALSRGPWRQLSRRVSRLAWKTLYNTPWLVLQQTGSDEVESI
jgi:hypothetical protein